jgi:hypothetical protein
MEAWVVGLTERMRRESSICYHCEMKLIEWAYLKVLTTTLEMVFVFPLPMPPFFVVDLISLAFSALGFPSRRLLSTSSWRLLGHDPYCMYSAISPSKCPDLHSQSRVSVRCDYDRLKSVVSCIEQQTLKRTCSKS